MTAERTAEDLLKAAERLLGRARSLDDVSVRRIAEAAGAGISAVSYHFGSREALITQAIRRIYRRFNAERLTRLQEAVDRHAPGLPPVEAVIRALIEPSVRWSFDRTSDYAAFTHFAALTLNAVDPTIRKAMADDVEHLGPFIAMLSRTCPHLSAGEIGWRIHCVLGVRHNAVRYRERGEILAGAAIDFSDPDAVLEAIVGVSARMFRP